MNAWRAWTNVHARGGPGLFPPELVVRIKALACELPATLGLPFSRLSTADIVREAQRSGLVARISDKTVWRWLHEDAIRPWQHRTWIFPRDLEFAAKAGRLLDLYARQYEGSTLTSDDFVMRAGSTKSRSTSRSSNARRLTPDDFRSLADVGERLLGFQRGYQSIATPFEWRFTKDDLAALLRKLAPDASPLAAVA